MPSGSPKPDQPVSFVLRRFQNSCLPISEVVNSASENSEKSLIGLKTLMCCRCSLEPSFFIIRRRIADSVNLP